MKTKLALVYGVFALMACAHPQAHDPYALMHTNLLQDTGSARQREVQKLLTEPDLNSHRVDWHRFASNGKTGKPLKGLRIALDPGHIGGTPWDERNGKYVTDSQGHKLSEGLMALQLAFLLKDEFSRLGATVFLDRSSMQPVTNGSFDDFAEISGLFFTRVDLDARAEKLWAFKPDITLILHFDAHLDHDMNIDHAKELCNDSKAYVPGAFTEKDLTGEERIFYQVVWRNPAVWYDSLDLSRAIVGNINKQLGVPLESDPHENYKLIEQGVYARNLRLQHRMAGYVSSYLESLCYEDKAEFQSLLKGKRLKQLADAIRDGVKEFVAEKSSAAVVQQ